MTAFTTLGLMAELEQAVLALGYQAPTPVQTAAIPPALAGRDLLARAQTGSGKTAAFALPLLQRLATTPATSGTGNGVRALVLAPTRELAMQLAQACDAYARTLSPRLKIRAVFGGVSINPQMMALRGGADLVIATPGRLLDLVAHNALTLARLEAVVFDEADKLLGLGFADELARILEQLPTRRQSLFFSATLGEEVQALAARLLRDPVAVDVVHETGPDIEQHVYTVDKPRKTALLAHLLASHDWAQVLVFASAKYDCDRVAEKLKRKGIAAAAFHGDLSQGARTQVLKQFSSGKLRVLIATDLAARGLDIAALPCVVNYELPRSPNDFVHRIGRTARAGAKGLALTLIEPAEYHHFSVIEKRMKQRLPREQIAGFEVSGNAPAVPGKMRGGNETPP